MSQADHQTGRLAKALREFFEAYLRAQSEGNAKAAMRHIHGQSPIYDSMSQMLGQLLLNYRLDCELLSLDYLGTDDDFTYVRVRQRTRKLEGPEFRDNVTDQLTAMVAEGSAWKLWAQALLDVEFEDAGGESHG